MGGGRSRESRTRAGQSRTRAGQQRAGSVGGRGRGRCRDADLCPGGRDLHLAGRARVRGECGPERRASLGEPAERVPEQDHNLVSARARQSENWAGRDTAMTRLARQGTDLWGVAGRCSQSEALPEEGLRVGRLELKGCGGVGKRLLVPSRRRDCHFDGTASPSLLKRLRNVEGGAAE